MIAINYFRAGRKHGYVAKNLTDAMNRKFALRKTYGIGFHGCSNFYYLDKDENKVWL